MERSRSALVIAAAFVGGFMLEPGAIVAQEVRFTPPDPPSAATRFGFNVAPVSGFRSLLVIRVRFVDADFPPDLSVREVNHLIFGQGYQPQRGSQRTLRGYYRENSYYKLDFQRAGLITVTYPTTFNCATGRRGLCRAGQLGSGRQIRTRAIVLAAEAGFPFHQFDRNRDGFVNNRELAILLLIAVHPRWRNTSQGYPGGWRDWGQTGPGDRGCPTIRSGSRTVRVCSAPSGMDANVSLMTIAHELAHQFRAIDIYGIGSRLNSGLSVMAGTIFKVRNDRRTFHFDPWHKMAFGWVRPRVFSLRGPGNCVFIDSAPRAGLRASLADRSPVILHDPLRSRREYFMLEYRHGGRLDYDANLQGSTLTNSRWGLAIWQIRINDRRMLYEVRTRIRTPGGGFKWGTEGSAVFRGAPRFTQGVGALWRASHGDIRLRWTNGQDAGITMRVGSTTARGLPVEWFRSRPLRGRISDPVQRDCVNNVARNHR